MNARDYLLKQYNKTVNNLLNVKFIFIKTFGLSNWKYKRFLNRLRRDYTAIRTFKLHNFYPMQSNNWGSARPDMDSTFDKDNVSEMSWQKPHNSEEAYTGIVITTTNETCRGLDFNGQRVIKPTTSASISTISLVYTKGIISADITLDPYAIGSWDAFWLLYDEPDGYFEIDIFERFYTSKSRCRKLTFSVHTGDSSTTNRRMYNHAVIVPWERFNIAIEFDTPSKSISIYIDGVKVFKGLQWTAPDAMNLILNSGVQNYNYIGNHFKRYGYSFKVSDIIQYYKL
jgi:hypothetical protein